MKKRWIPFIAVTLIMIFVGGVLLGSATEVQQQDDLWIARLNVRNTIAVVNSDVGVMDEDGNRLNYSAAIIQALEEEFVQASPALAETGFYDGTFGAIVTFPYHTSERVLSFNERYPQRVQLEFMINPNLSERDYVETYIRILNLQMSINNALAHTYVISIFGQLHAAQGQVPDIVQNKERDLTAMEIIALEQFTPSLSLEYIPEIPFDPASFDGSGRLVSKEGFASSVASLYQESYAAATASFMAMREGVFAMTEEVPQQATGWLRELEVWATQWEEFGEALEEYKALVIEVIDDLEQLLEELEEYLDDVERLMEVADDFFDSLYDWHGDLEDTFNELEGFFLNFLVLMGSVNTNIDRKVMYREDLEDWQDYLTARYGQVEGWQADSIWYNTMGNTQTTALNQINAARGARPLREDFDPPAPEESIEYQEAVANWYVNAVNASAIALGNLVDHLNLQFADPALPPNIFADLEAFVHRQPLPVASLSLSTTAIEGLTWERLEQPVGLSIEPFEGEFPDLFDPFDEQLPEEVAPESVEGFLDPLDGLRGQIETFDVGAYLTEAVWQAAEGQIAGVGSYLGAVGGELDAHVQNNYMLLNRIYLEYVDYLTRLRQTAVETETSESENLQERLERFHDVHNVTRLDTVARLIDFSGMMPESRDDDGVNPTIVDHTITPLEFTPPILREEFGGVGGESLWERFATFLWIGISLTLLVFLVTLASCFIPFEKIGKRKSTDKIKR